MYNNTLQIIYNEYNDLRNNPIASIGTSICMPDPNNPYEWRCTMIGPTDTSFAGGLFYLKILFPPNYPQTGPDIRFITPIYHVNVNHIKQPNCPLGHICLSTLNFWRPDYTIREALTNIFALFYMGNADSPYGVNRQIEMKNNPALFEKKVKYFTNKYANINLGYKEYDYWDFSYPNK